MTTSMRFRLGATATVCAATLLIVAFGFSLVTVQADSDAKEAVKKAADAVNIAKQAEDAAATATGDAAKAAAESAKDAAPPKKYSDDDDTKQETADRVAKEADDAAKAADDAKEKAKKATEEKDAADAAAAAPNATDEDKAKRDAAALQWAEALGTEQRTEREAAKKEKESDEADKQARAAGQKRVKDAQVNGLAAARSKRKRARAARRRARQARREAAQAILDAEKALALQAARIGGNQSTTQELKDALEAEKKKLAALANASYSPLPGNFISQGNFIPQPIGSGIKVGEFNVPAGRITVTLPDDIRAGDTISGTVIAEPNGKTKDDRDKNARLLATYSIAGVSSSKIPVADDPDEVLFVTDFYGRPDSGGREATDSGRAGVVFRINPTNTTSSAPAQVNVGVFLIQNINSPVGPCVRYGAIPAIIEGCSPISQLVFKAPDPKNGFFIQTPDGGDTATASDEGIFVFTRPEPDSVYGVPSVGQTGKPVVITGPFDGDATNTGITCEPTGSTQPPPTYTPGQPIYVLAESPRKAVFTSPSNLTGPLQVTVGEGGKKTTMPFRNVGVNLTAPKTSLLKGEQTRLTVQVTGLQNLTRPVPLTLECNGVITMTGGTYQPLTIQPSQVGADGRYTTTRDITGVQAGGWGATATVVTHRFDVCMQDDSNRNSGILWNTFTGDYIFITMGVPPRPSGQPPSGGTISPGGTPAVPPGGTSLSGTGKPIMKGCIITLSHNAPDRRVFARLDTCTKTGEASVQTGSPSTQFTITDRNIADNTCGGR